MRLKLFIVWQPKLNIWYFFRIAFQIELEDWEDTHTVYDKQQIQQPDISLPQLKDVL